MSFNDLVLGTVKHDLAADLLHPSESDSFWLHRRCQDLCQGMVREPLAFFSASANLAGSTACEADYLAQNRPQNRHEWIN